VMPHNSRTSILILGASQMQMPAIQIGRELGWRVVVADVNPTAPGVALADEFEQVDLKDLSGMTEAARRQQSSDGLDGVFTAGTDFSATVAWVSEHLGLPGIPYKTALDASDKSRMRGVFTKAGLPSPKFVTIDSGIDPLTVLDALSLPLVIKPVDSMGARGVRRIDAASDLSQATEDALQHSRCGNAIIEQYINGPEFSLDAVVYEGHIHLCGIADRHIHFPPYFVEMGHTMPSGFDETDQQQVIDLFFAGIRALGISTGAAKGDIKLSANGPVIGEIAARLSGGYMSGWTYPYSSGVRVTEAAMRIAVGLSPGELAPTVHRTAAERAFISIPGIVLNVEGEESIRDDVAEFFLRVESGSSVRFPINNVQKCGNVICVDSDRRSAIAKAERACRGISVQLEPFDSSTADYLFGDLDGWAPDAYHLTDSANTESLAAMRPLYGAIGAPLEGIVALPTMDAEAQKDWHGLPFFVALSRLLLRSSLAAVPGDALTGGGLVLGGLFWRAFLRGGEQGGRWMIDSIESLSASSDPRWREVLSWCE
jgi:biotin carboxylase